MIFQTSQGGIWIRSLEGIYILLSHVTLGTCGSSAGRARCWLALESVGRAEGLDGRCPTWNASLGSTTLFWKGLKINPPIFTSSFWYNLTWQAMENGPVD